MPSREEAREIVQHLRSLSGGDDVTRLAAARLLARLSPIDATELLQEIIVLAREGYEHARPGLAAFTRALDMEASQIPYAPQMRRIAALSELKEVETLFPDGEPLQEYDQDAAKRADAKLFTQSLGHLKTQARLTRDPDQLARIAAASNPEVVRNVLINPRITEALVVRIAARRPARPEPLVEIWHSERWSTRPAVRRALVFNPYLPPDVGAKIVPLLSVSDLKELASTHSVHAALREQAKALLDVSDPVTATKLSESPLWRWSREFYERASTQAWSQGTVPWRLTNSVKVAEAYGRMVSAWRTDLIASGRKTASDPIQVLELGGGAGRLAFHLVRWLEAAKVPFQLTWTDVARSNVEAFKARPFVVHRPGVVEAVRLDALSSEQGPPLAPDVVIASYLFDSLPHDAWAVRQGQVLEQRVTVHLPEGDAPECERAELDWADHPGDVPSFVRGYAPRVREGVFMVPTGAIACLQRVAAWSSGRCLVLAADKGEPDVTAVQSGGTPKLQRHGGISAMVNFDALRAWWGWRPFLKSAQAEPDLGFYAMAQGLTTLATTRATWSSTLGAESPLQRLRQLDRLLGHVQPAPVLLETLASWGHDPDIFVRMAEYLRQQAPQLLPDVCLALVVAIDKTWANHFEVGGTVDVAFEMASVLHRAGQLSHAARFYERSLNTHGRHATVCFNLALCWLDLGERDQGARLLAEVLQLAPGHAGALRVLAQLEAALANGP